MKNLWRKIVKKNWRISKKGSNKIKELIKPVIKK